MEQFLKSLGITQTGELKGDSYVITLNNSNEFGRIYSKLEKGGLQEDNETSKVTESSADITMFDDEYTVVLKANFDNDEYSLTITEE